MLDDGAREAVELQRHQLGVVEPQLLHLEVSGSMYSTYNRSMSHFVF